MSRFWTLAVGVALVLAPLRSLAALSGPTGDLAGTVLDSISGKPIASATVTLSQNGAVTVSTITDAYGHFVVHNLAAGVYSVEVRYLGYAPITREAQVTAGETPATLAFRLNPAPFNLQAISVTASAPIAIDTRSGDQVFDQNNFHGSPTLTTSQVVQQSIAGAARAPTGEVHIRGQHDEYTYVVDGIPVPSGISGSLNELFDPAIVNSIDFQTGGWDAEWGDKNTAVINVNTRIPTGGLHMNASTYGGSFAANGQALSLSDNIGRWGFFLSGSLDGTDMRQEPVVLDSATNVIENYHNQGHDIFGFGKIQFVPNDRDILTLDLNRSRTNFAIPYDSTLVSIDDHQQDVNGFVNLAWHHRFITDSSETGRVSELFVGPYYRDGTLNYTPGASDQASFIFYPSTTPYNLSEDRSFNTEGLKVDYTYQPHHGLEFKTGILASVTSGHEVFQTTDSAGNPGPVSNSGLNGSDEGAYIQTAISPSDRWELRVGARFDNHNAPFAGNQDQLSPRVKLSFFPDPKNTLWVYYGRMFIPTNIEDLRSITSIADSGVATAPTLPERDDFFELGFIHRFPAGVVTKLSGYYKHSTPGIDDNTVPGSSIVTDVNISQVWIRGVEAVVEAHGQGPLTGYVNFALNHAYGIGPITGGFFPTQTPTGYFDLDHDQRISALANLVYSTHHGFYVSATGIYGTGLTNGVDPSTDPNYCTGLLCFNSAVKVPPSFILNGAAGYAFDVGTTVVRPEINLDNALNNTYLLKGAFFSGSYVGRPRSVEVSVKVSV
jgi:hypothetical protein